MSVEIKVPAAGESITEVYIGQWNVEEGEWIDQDASVVELESDKATFQLPAPIAGCVTKILKNEGDSAQIGDVIGHMEQVERPDEDSPKKESDEDSPEKKTDGAGALESTDATSKAESPETESSPRIMPSAARMLAENDIEPAQVSATGPGGRLLKEDVARHLQQKTDSDDSKKSESPQAQAREVRAVRMSPIRKRIAERLVEAQQTAALLTTFNEIDMTEVIQLRRAHKESFQQKYDVKLGFMSFFIKAAVDALNVVPQVNAAIEDDQIVYRNYCDIGVAVGSGKGLVVPVLRNAERMSFAEIELTINDFGQRAQKNQIQLEELQGGTFTISNGGVYGSLLSTPIVNPPQSGVLGMHAIQERPIGVEGQIVLRPMMYVALTYDHRLVDGREAVTFLRRIKDVVEEPSRMLLEI